MIYFIIMLQNQNILIGPLDVQLKLALISCEFKGATNLKPTGILVRKTCKMLTMSIFFENLVLLPN